MALAAGSTLLASSPARAQPSTPTAAGFIARQAAPAFELIGRKKSRQPAEEQPEVDTTVRGTNSRMPNIPNDSPGLQAADPEGGAPAYEEDAVPPADEPPAYEPLQGDCNPYYEQC